MRIKVCGVTRAADARLAARLGAWAVGMIFVPETPRFLTLARARKVRAAIPKGVLAVGVFRDPPRAELRAFVRALRLDAVQIHGKAPRAPGVPVIAVHPERARLTLVEPRRTDADRRAGRVPSPRARLAAWRTARALRARGVRVLLAGGLAPDNAARACAAARPWALDVSSGVERRPGVKDARLLRAFFSALPEGPKK